ncbi:MAG TPA: hypothetical protein ACFYEK_01190 [Candidatus Wunengus sp. YC60]|uniref:hypothetical protein n=1 Tax=Candidatus Wunengus sp. YC60 TaxID=3367697 RepID=UPI0040298DEE
MTYFVYNYENQNIEGYFDNEIEAEEYASTFKNATVYPAEKKPEVKLLFDVIKFASIDQSEIPTGMLSKFIDKHTYMDNDVSLSEHLYAGGEIWDDHLQKRIFNSEEEIIFKQIIKEMELLDCAYFRIVKR